MSGGFFRGTSFEQDTRFSNKQAKLMKSQKFPPELEHLVDMTKVKMDVVKPWIATRVTEFLGFEDEVLINFIYGLLDAKEVNGKEVQIQLTGFMEKNTGKFMKELWSLLLSAQKNASGVPQQLLDAKEEETRLKLAERDRITAEILKEKENIDSELTRQRKMDGGAETKANNASMDPSSKQIQLKGSSGGPGDEKETEIRNGSRGRSRLSRSPHSSDHSPSSPRSREISSPVRSQRSGARNVKERKDLSRRVPAVLSSPERSPVQSGSPPPVKKRSNNDDKRYDSPARKVKGRDNSLSPPQPKEQRSRYESSDTSKDGEENGRPHKLKDSPAKAQYKGKQSLETGVGHQTTESRSQSRLDQGKREQESRSSEKLSGRKDHSREGSEGQKSPVLNQTDAQKPVVGRHSHGNTAKDDRRPKTDTITSSGKADHSNGGNKHDSDSDRSGKHIIEGKEKRKHKRSHRHETSSDDDYSHDSEIEEKKESKKRRKEEKKLRKEEKRRRREERRRKREERRAEKLKRKDQDETSSSDDDHVEKKRKSHQSDDEKDDSEQRKLEIELRKKALESLKAKKGIDH
ncbi:Serine/arginine repetitive matrix protein 1 [Linum perenne]